MNRLTTIVILFSIVIVSGCGAIQPRFDSRAPAEPTKDGLWPVLNTEFKLAWARQGVSFSEYDAIHLVNGGVKYRRAGTGPDDTRRPTPYEFPDSLYASIVSMLEETTLTALTKEGDWRIAKPGTTPALAIRTALLDMVVFVSPETMKGTDPSFAEAAAEATYVAEVFDAETGQVLARFLERRKITRESSDVIRSDYGSVEYQSRALLTLWAKSLREALWAFKDQGIAN